MDAFRKLLIQGYTAIQYTNYLAVAAYTLTIVDYIHTLPDEIRLMWGNPWGAGKSLFFAVRYGAFVHIGLHGLHLIPGLSPKTCKSIAEPSAYTSLIVVGGAEAILCLRVYAFTGGSRKMLAFLSIQFFVTAFVAFWLAFKYIQSVKYQLKAAPNMVCMPVAADRQLAAIAFLTMLTNVFTVMVIMLYTEYKRYKYTEGGIFRVFYRDGVIYFFVILALAVANSLVNFFASPFYTYLLIQPEVLIHAILSTRMLLHLRDTASRRQSLQSGEIYTMCSFTRRDGHYTTKPWLSVLGSRSSLGGPQHIPSRPSTLKNV